MQNRTQQLLLFTILFSIILRAAAAILLGNEVVDLPGTADQLSYHHLALRVLQGHGFSFGEPWWPATHAGAPTAHWSYLYTAYLVAVYALFGPNPLIARLIQAVAVGMLQPLLVYLIGRHIFGQAVGLVAAFLTAIYAYFIYYSANLMTEPFYITAILASFYLALRMAPMRMAPIPAVEQSAISHLNPESTLRGTRLKLAVALGITLGITLLLRQLFLLFVPFLFLWILLHSRKQVVPLLVASVIIAVTILPITAFNYTRFGRIVLINTNAGFAFFWGNHPIYGTQFEPILPSRMGTYLELIPHELRHLDEASLDQALLERGIGFILDDPVRYGLLSLSRAKVYFMFWPSSDSSPISNIARVSSFGLLWPGMLYGLLFSFTHRPSPFQIRPPSPVLLLYLFIVIYTAIHLLTWTLIRYRLPVDAFLLIFAGLAAVDLALRVPALRRLVRSIA